MASAILIAILSYALGSIPFSLIISRVRRGIDIREYGSKNAGFTNVYRVIGPLPALMVLILDVAKGMAAVLLVTRISLGSAHLDPINLKIIAGICVVVGHVFPIFFGFRGGKGILAALGALLSLIPVEMGMSLILFVLIVAITRYVSLGSLSATVFILFALLFEKYYLGSQVPGQLIAMMAFLTIFIFFNHRSNIKRLLAGTENKFRRKGL
ncbi:MAG: glycerol-3-phosphate 1-O-acyltransferase PlsY [Candidatus Zixiibacteriota bacterium]